MLRRIDAGGVTCPEPLSGSGTWTKPPGTSMRPGSFIGPDSASGAVLCASSLCRTGGSGF